MLNSHHSIESGGRPHSRSHSKRRKAHDRKKSISTTDSIDQRIGEDEESCIPPNSWFSSPKKALISPLNSFVTKLYEFLPVPKNFPFNLTEKTFTPRYLEQPHQNKPHEVSNQPEDDPHWRLYAAAQQFLQGDSDQDEPQGFDPSGNHHQFYQQSHPSQQSMKHTLSHSQYSQDDFDDQSSQGCGLVGTLFRPPGPANSNRSSSSYYEQDYHSDPSNPHPSHKQQHQQQQYPYQHRTSSSDSRCSDSDGSISPPLSHDPYNSGSLCASTGATTNAALSTTALSSSTGSSYPLKQDRRSHHQPLIDQRIPFEGGVGVGSSQSYPHHSHSNPHPDQQQYPHHNHNHSPPPIPSYPPPSNIPLENPIMKFTERPPIFDESHWPSSSSSTSSNSSSSIHNQQNHDNTTQLKSFGIVTIGDHGEVRIVAPHVGKLSPHSTVEVRLRSSTETVSVLCSVDVLKMRSVFFQDILAEQEKAYNAQQQLQQLQQQQQFQSQQMTQPPQTYSTTDPSSPNSVTSGMAGGVGQYHPSSHHHHHHPPYPQQQQQQQQQNYQYQQQNQQQDQRQQQPSQQQQQQSQFPHQQRIGMAGSGSGSSRKNQQQPIIGEGFIGGFPRSVSQSTMDSNLPNFSSLTHSDSTQTMNSTATQLTRSRYLQHNNNNNNNNINNNTNNNKEISSTLSLEIDDSSPRKFESTSSSSSSSSSWREPLVLHESSPYEAAAFLESLHEGRTLFKGEWNICWARLSANWGVEDLILEYATQIDTHITKLLSLVSSRHWRTNPEGVLGGMRVAIFRKGVTSLPTVVTGIVLSSKSNPSSSLSSSSSSTLAVFSSSNSYSSISSSYSKIRVAFDTDRDRERERERERELEFLRSSTMNTQGWLKLMTPQQQQHFLQGVQSQSQQQQHSSQNNNINQIQIHQRPSEKNSSLYSTGLSSNPFFPTSTIFQQQQQQTTSSSFAFQQPENCFASSSLNSSLFTSSSNQDSSYIAITSPGKGKEITGFKSPRLKNTQDLFAPSPYSHSRIRRAKEKELEKQQQQQQQQQSIHQQNQPSSSTTSTSDSCTTLEPLTEIHSISISSSSPSISISSSSFPFSPPHNPPPPVPTMPSSSSTTIPTTIPTTKDTQSPLSLPLTEQQPTNQTQFPSLPLSFFPPPHLLHLFPPPPPLTISSSSVLPSLSNASSSLFNYGNYPSHFQPPFISSSTSSSNDNNHHHSHSIPSQPAIEGEISEPFWIQQSFPNSDSSTSSSTSSSSTSSFSSTSGGNWYEPDELFYEIEIYKNNLITHTDKRVLWEMISLIAELPHLVQSCRPSIKNLKELILSTLSRKEYHCLWMNNNKNNNHNNNGSHHLDCLPKDILTELIGNYFISNSQHHNNN